MLRIFMAIVFTSQALLLSACVGNVIPKELEKQVDRSISFAQIKQNPDQYRGHLVVAGGEVLSIKRSPGGSRIEVLQLPLDGSLEPAPDRISSQGRFLAIPVENMDPATLPPGSRITVVGDVNGITTLPLDEIEYPYPTLAVKHLKLWEQRPPSAGFVPMFSIGLGAIFVH